MALSRAIIFANGKPRNGVMVQEALSQADDAHLIAADGGNRIARHFQLSPTTLIGDMDSIDPTQLQQLEAQGVDIYRYPDEKNETDLELAIIYATEQGHNCIRIIGGVGGRFDHMLANVYLLALPQLDGCDSALVARNQRMRLLKQGDNHLAGEIGDTLSLIPVSGDVHGITTQALKYALNDETLYFGPARGISNVFEDTTVTVTVSNGVLLAIQTRDAD